MSIITGVAVWFVTILPFDVEVTGGDGGWWQRALIFLGIGALMALLNAIVKPIVKFLSLPILILTLGLFSLVIGWFMLWFTAWITEGLNFVTLTIGGFWDTLWAALVIAIVTSILTAIVPGAKKPGYR